VEQDLEAQNTRAESNPVPEGQHEWLPELDSFLRTRSRGGESGLRDRFLEIVFDEIERNGKNYLHIIKGLSQEAANIGTRWLQGIVDEVTDGAFQIIPILNAQP
jgi:hypothetical protein